MPGNQTSGGLSLHRLALSSPVSSGSRKLCIAGPGFVYRALLCPQFGALRSLTNQPDAVDFRGSDAMTLISTRSHLGHSNSRCSKPIGPGETRSSIIRVWQREQRGRSIAVRNCWDGDMMLPCIGRERYRTLGHRWLPMADGDGVILPRRTAEKVVNIAHLRKFHLRKA